MTLPCEEFLANDFALFERGAGVRMIDILKGVEMEEFLFSGLSEPARLDKFFVGFGEEMGGRLGESFISLCSAA